MYRKQYVCSSRTSTTTYTSTTYYFVQCSTTTGICSQYTLSMNNAAHAEEAVCAAEAETTTTGSSFEAEAGGCSANAGG